MSGFGYTTEHYWHWTWSYYFRTNDYNVFNFPTSGHPLISTTTGQLDPKPLTKAAWDALPWDLDAHDNVMPKPTWAELLAPYAAHHRKQLDKYMEGLHRAYEYQVRKHLPTLYHRSDILPFIDLMTAAGRSDDAVRARQWADFLFFRFLEMKHALVHGNDEVIMGMVQCHEEFHLGKGPWDYDVTWTGPTFSFHSTLPPYRKAHTIMSTIPAVPAPPSGVTVERRDASTLIIISSGPAAVSVGHPGGFFEVAFPVAGEKPITVAAPEPPAVETVRLGWTAYGEEHSSTVEVPPLADD